MSRSLSASALWVALCVLIAIGFAGATNAQDAVERDSRWSLEGGIGLTASPTSFLLSLASPYQLSDHFSLVPLFQLGVTGGRVIVSPSANVRYAFDLSGVGPEGLRTLVPFVDGGLGFTYMKRNAGDLSDTGFLMTFGGGIEYPLRPGLALGTTMRFNVLPTGVLGDKFFYSWEIAGLRYKF